MVFQKISGNAYAVVGRPAYANVAALVLPRKVVLVDCGIHLAAVKEVRREIEGVSGKKVETVILTHYHSDHTHGLQAFSDCRIISSSLLLRNLKLAVRKTPKGFKPTLPNETFDDQLEIRDEDVRLVIERTGGHTDCSTYVYCPNYRIVVAGDNLVSDCYPWGARKGDPEVWIQTLKEYLSLDAEYYIPGHGRIDGKDNVARLLDYLTNVSHVMKKMIAQGSDEKDVLEASKAIKYRQSRPGPTLISNLRNWYRFWQAQSGQSAIGF